MSTETSRDFRVDEARTLREFRVLGHPPLAVDPPVICFPGRLYRAELDLENGTATIHSASEEAPHVH